MNTCKWFFSTPLGIMEELQISKAAVIIIAHVSNIRAETNNKSITVSPFSPAYNNIKSHNYTLVYKPPTKILCTQLRFQNEATSTLRGQPSHPIYGN
jgi:hypothetical protein